jgi:hypothetical protein
LSQVTITSLEDKSIYSDLISEFLEHGHQVTVISAFERRNFRLTSNPDKFELIKVKTPNLQKTTKIEKAIGHIAFDFQLLYAIKKHLIQRDFDICLYYSPPITITKTLSFVKKHFNTFNYLWLKDIFPQNAIDMGLLRENSIIHKYFRQVEQKYYRLSDKIGVMSPANKDYLLKFNTELIPNENVEVCPNCVKLRQDGDQSSLLVNDNGIYKFIYGGNLGVPQAIPFIIDVLEEFLNHPKIEFEIIGSGTEFPKLQKWILDKKPQNINLTPFLPKNEFNIKVKNADIGLVFLNHNFSIPNFPSRLLTYLENMKPVLCFTDSNTDIGIIAKENKFGDWASSFHKEDAIKLIGRYIQKPKKELKVMGKNGYDFLLNNYTTEIVYNTIMNSYGLNFSARLKKIKI